MAAGCRSPPATDSSGSCPARHAEQAEVVALDARNVLAVARENAAATGVAARCRTIEGQRLHGGLGHGE
jgi:hypothetical protein